MGCSQRHWGLVAVDLHLDSGRVRSKRLMVKTLLPAQVTTLIGSQHHTHLNHSAPRPLQICLHAFKFLCSLSFLPNGMQKTLSVPLSCIVKKTENPASHSCHWVSLWLHLKAHTSQLHSRQKTVSSVVGVDRYVFFRADTDYYRSSRPITDILNRYTCLV